VFDFSQSVFGPNINIPSSARVIFVSDMFVEDYVGGAELTSQALIDSSPLEVFRVHAKDVSVELLKEGSDRFWVFGNFATMNPQLIPSIIGNLRYSLLEYDFKFCRSRSPEKHQHDHGTPCDCHHQMNGKIVSAFFYGSMGNWWMSEKQKERYLTTFPFLSERPNTVLSSVFDPKTLGLLKALREANKGTERKGWIVLGSDSWIKGAEDAKAWCEANNKEYEVVWNLPYNKVLEKLARAEGFVYLPPGGDTCPRMVIEAKLLGCKLQLNDNVLHKDEEWFTTDDLESIEGYLFVTTKHFWNGIKSFMDYKPTISGYTTCYNCVKQQYPFEQCIQSMLAFCTEVCVVDGGSTDGTWAILLRLAAETATQDDKGNVQLKLKCKQVKRDWSIKRHPVFDGMQKAEARKMCSGDFCWQMDSDEVVHEDDCKKIQDMCRMLPKGVDIMALPVIEYWGGADKVRMDVQPWKWRLSRNLPHITHGIPVELRMTDADGQAYAKPGTDGCDMVDATSGQRLGHMSFYSPDIEQLRQVAMLGNEQARQQYEGWYNQAVAALPGVFHYSWFDLSRKIRLYRDYWANHWRALWDQDTSDTTTNNFMFDCPWSQVTDEMIETRAVELSKIGGWVWHRKWCGEKTPWITCTRTQPLLMQSYAEGKVHNTTQLVTA
jgi:glycosyltransferase involved in cell wall biosynthesis